MAILGWYNIYCTEEEATTSIAQIRTETHCCIVRHFTVVCWWVMYLLDRRADTHLQNNAGDTPLHLVASGRSDLGHYFLDQEDDVLHGEDDIVSTLEMIGIETP
jgi:ankyrin repeat protein